MLGFPLIAICVLVELCTAKPHLWSTKKWLVIKPRNFGRHNSHVTIRPSVLTLNIAELVPPCGFFCPQ